MATEQQLGVVFEKVKKDMFGEVAMRWDATVRASQAEVAGVAGRVRVRSPDNTQVDKDKFHYKSFRA